MRATTEDETTLRAAIARLYAVFERYPSDHRGPACPHCVGEPERARLHATPLAALSWDDFGRYATKAVTTWGDADAFRHFLPRLLELVACGEALPARPGRFSDDEAPFDVELTLGKLDLAGLAAWPLREREAVEAFMRARLRFLLGEPPGRPTPGNWVLQAACSGVALTPLLDEWAADSRAQAALHLAAWVHERLPQLASGGLRSAFLESGGTALRCVTAWVRAQGEWLMAATERCPAPALDVWTAAEALVDLAGD